MIGRLQIVVGLLCFPFITLAAPTSDECIREVMAAQDRCSQERSRPIGQCVQEKLTPTCAKQVVKQPPTWAPDATCQQEVEREARHCDASLLIKQCWRERLSPNCMKQVEAGAGPQADAACKQELQQAAAPCSQTATSKAKQCLQERLSPNCREESKITEQQTHEDLKSCQEALQNVQHLCGPDRQKGQQCYQKYQAELSAACREKFEGRQ